MRLSKRQKLRRLVQIASFSISIVFLALVIIGGNFVIHQACPYAMICFGMTGGNFLQIGRVAMWAAILFGVGNAIYSMIWGRGFCGWLCPLGSLQEWIFNTRKPKYRLQHKMKVSTDRKFAWVKYLALVVTTALAILGLGYVFMQFCPFFALAQIPKIMIGGLVLLVAVIITSFFRTRIWCRFLCPYAAIMNVFEWLGEKTGICRRIIKRNLEFCTSYGVCELFCPMNIYITEKEYVHNHNCIHCDLCIETCPKSDINIGKEFKCPE
jgi:polyferredoxin